MAEVENVGRRGNEVKRKRGVVGEGGRRKGVGREGRRKKRGG